MERQGEEGLPVQRGLRRNDEQIRKAS